MKLSKVDFTDGKNREVSPPFTTQLNKWYKVKCVHYNDANNYRFRGTVDGEVILDLQNLDSHNYEYMKLRSQSINPIGNLQNIRIAGKFILFLYAEDFDFYLELESVCFKITSAPDDICGDDKNKYDGNEIQILQNGIPVSKIPAKFPHFHECFGWRKDDIFEFKANDGDGVSYLNLKLNSTKVVFKICITSFFVNDRQLLFGNFSQLKSFWLDADPDVCREDAMSTSNLKIKNGEVIESQCKSNKCTDDWIKYDNRKIAQTGNKHSQEFSTLEEAKTACMKLSFDDCISIDENRENENSVVFNLKRFSKLTNNKMNLNHASYIRPKCRQDGE